MSKQAYKFRLYPTSKQIQALTWTLDRCRELYNAALNILALGRRVQAAQAS